MRGCVWFLALAVRHITRKCKRGEKRAQSVIWIRNRVATCIRNQANIRLTPPERTYHIEHILYSTGATGLDRLRVYAHLSLSPAMSQAIFYTDCRKLHSISNPRCPGSPTYRIRASCYFHTLGQSSSCLTRNKMEFSFRVHSSRLATRSSSKESTTERFLDPRIVSALPS